MRVLSVSSGNSGKINPIIYTQMQSLENAGLSVDYYLCHGKGLWGYLSNYFSLRKRITSGSYDLIHAHYALCGFLVGFIKPKIPMIVSLMGGELYNGRLLIQLIRLFTKFLWDKVIVKSDAMYQILMVDYLLGKIEVLANGVDLERFVPMAQSEARIKVGWDANAKIVLFGSSGKRPEKNYSLAVEAVDLLDLQGVQLKTLDGVAHEDVPFYLNAADVILLTSRWEGSPNIIKEAMACNKQIITTPVGDVSWLFANDEHLIISPSDKFEISKYLFHFLTNSKAVISSPRQRVIHLRLSKGDVANKIIHIYQNVIDVN